MNILITGGAGYIGSLLTRSILIENSNTNITCIDNLFHKDNIHVPIVLKKDFTDRYNFIKDDIHNTKLLHEEIAKADIVIHLAALVGFPTCDKYPRLAISTHIDCTAEIAKVINNKPLIYLNTNSGYGTTDSSNICTEDTPMNPVSLYGRTKCEGEKIVRSCKNHIVLRLATLFGTSYRMRRDLLVNNFVWKAYKDKYNIIFDEKAKRNFVHINDVIRLLNALATTQHFWTSLKNDVYNFGNDELNMSKLDLANIINEIIPHDIRVGNVGSDPDKRDYIVSSDKIIRKGWPNSFNNIRLAIKDLIDIYKIIDEPQYGNY